MNKTIIIDKWSKCNGLEGSGAKGATGLTKVNGLRLVAVNKTIRTNSSGAPFFK